IWCIPEKFQGLMHGNRLSSGIVEFMADFGCVKVAMASLLFVLIAVLFNNLPSSKHAPHQIRQFYSGDIS
ncbi:MAG: hypothetical protein WCA63_06540, partial [Gallionella sp.]